MIKVAEIWRFEKNGDENEKKKYIYNFGDIAHEVIRELAIPTLHSMMSWNLASKKRKLEFGSYCHVVSPTNLKKPIPSPLWKKSQNLAFESEIIERTKSFKNEWNFFIK